MSLAIDIDKVSGVLLSDGRWYKVAWNSSERRYDFDADAYEVGEFWENPPGNHKNHLMLPGGAQIEAGIPSLGFRFTTDNEMRLVGPFNSIIALQMDYERATKHDST